MRFLVGVSGWIGDAQRDTRLTMGRQRSGTDPALALWKASRAGRVVCCGGSAAPAAFAFRTAVILVNAAVGVGGAPQRLVVRLFGKSNAQRRTIVGEFLVFKKV